MKKVLLGICLVIGVIAGVAVLIALPVMLLWNYVMPAIFGLCTITFKQALALSLLCGLLFGDKNIKIDSRDKK